MTQIAADLALANRRLLKKLLVVSVLMFGFGFALIPFYQKIPILIHFSISVKFLCCIFTTQTKTPETF